jgi:outer membrane protein OmpA-like peptidoglycan-associated protein
VTQSAKTLTLTLLVGLMCMALAPPAFTQQNTVTGDQTSGYHMKVVSRSTQAVDYRHKGSTKVDLKGTDLAPTVDGEAKVEGRAGDVRVDVDLRNLRPANSFGLAYLTYVLWAITPEGRPKNLGELIVNNDGKTGIHATTEVQAFALIVTAEPYFAVTEPSDLVVAQNVIRRDTKGGVEPVDVRFELISRETYDSQVQPINQTVYEVSNKTPLDLLEARNAVRIANDAQAGQYASAELQKAQDLLNQAEDYYRRKQGLGPIGTVAREAAQTAEEARVMSIKAEHDAEVQQAQQSAEDQAAKAQADAQAQQAAAAQAQDQAAQAQQAQQLAEQQRQQAELARQQAELAQQQAAQQAQQADQARQQAEADKAQMRARMLQQLNQVLETRDTARGLIVNMPDVLFDTSKADLRQTARERLAKVAGILLAYPDIRVEIDGYTDSTGSLDFNERLSQQRADSVRNYLASQGVNSASMTTQGFGPNQPVAPNDTASGRQQNRRVEMVVSGPSIGQSRLDDAPQPDGTSTAPASAPRHTPQSPTQTQTNRACRAAFNALGSFAVKPTKHVLFSYEMAGYGAVRTLADLLEEQKASELLQQTLDEEKEADEALTKLAG